MYLFIDTETTGLPLDYTASIENLDNWPRLVQLAYQIYTIDGILYSEKNIIIRPNGFEIPRNATKIHGISTEIAQKNGTDLIQVLVELNKSLDQTEIIIAHNLQFDSKIIEAELLRNHLYNGLTQKKGVCTMLSTTEFCGLKNHHGLKWPKLSELYFKLFNTQLKGAHNAYVDIQATSKCFWELKKRGIL